MSRDDRYESHDRYDDHDDDRYEHHDRYDDHDDDDHGSRDHHDSVSGSDDHYEHAYGSGGDDWLRGSDSDDQMEGGSGNDELYGHRGADRLIGGDGDDLMRGGRGADELIGGAGADVLWGDLGANTIRAGAGDGVSDHIFITADSVMNNLGNPDGIRRDLLLELDTFDRIVFTGIDDSRLTYVSDVTDPRGSGVVGVGIYVDGTLEALVQSGLSAAQVDGITTGLV